jgi:RNA polymerase sigma-70 factor (sigma-E family)
VNDADAGEFTTFVAARSPSLLRTAYLLTGSDQAAEDLLQTALLATLRHWRRIRDRDSLEAFVRRVMVNERRSWFRRRTSSEVTVATIHDWPTVDVHARVEDSELLQRALLTLPQRQRATLVLRFFDDLPEAEVANILGCSVGTVKSQTSKGLAKLRGLLTEIDERCQL